MEEIAPINQASENVLISRNDVYQQITDTIIKQLETGTVPWQKSWQENNTGFGIPRNLVTGNTYRGINILLLWCAANEKQYPSNEWASFKQWASKDEAIRKGEKGNMIVYADTFEKEVNGEIQKIPFLKQTVVFNRCQLASYTPSNMTMIEHTKSLVDKIESADNFVSNTFAEIEHRDGGACYSPKEDKIYMPLANTFFDTKNCTASEGYYSTKFHELTHWTGHSKRLDRKIKNIFGSHAYAEEELIAELGAAFLCSEFEMSNAGKENHAAYVANWLTVLKDNKRFITSAASEASKAVEYLKDLQPLKL